MPADLPSSPGDVLVLRTTRTFTIFAIGEVTQRGQRDFHGPAGVTHASSYAEALEQATALLPKGRRLFFRDLDTGDWYEIPPG